MSLFQKQDGSELTVEDWRACSHNYAEIQLNELGLAVADGNIEAVVRFLQIVNEQETDVMQIIRAVLSHLYRLLKLKSDVAQGKSIHEAVSQARPFIFFKHQARYKSQLQRWNLEQLLQAIKNLFLLR